MPSFMHVLARAERRPAATAWRALSRRLAAVQWDGGNAPVKQACQVLCDCWYRMVQLSTLRLPGGVARSWKQGTETLPLRRV